jgi:hypothetical protein
LKRSRRGLALWLCSQGIEPFSRRVRGVL